MKINKIITLISLVAIIIGCTKDEEAPATPTPEEPEPVALKVEVSTLEALVDPEGGVTLKGTLKNIQKVKNHGFIFASDSVSGLREILWLGKPLIEGSFETQVNSGMRKGENYYFKGFAEGDKGITLGRWKHFISPGNKPPIITSVSLAEGHFLDTVLISGRNFGKDILFKSVQLDTRFAKIIYINDSLIRFLVPADLEVISSQITVYNWDKKTTSDDLFKLSKPEITSIAPEHATFRDLIEINGEHFDTDPQRIQVFFGEQQAKIAGASRNRLVVVVPDELISYSSKIKVKTHLQEVESNSLFHLTAPTITKIPVTAKAGEEATIEGSNFHPLNNRNRVYFGSVEAEVIGVGKSWIKVRIPDGPFADGEVKIKVEVLGLEAISENVLILQDI